MTKKRASPSADSFSESPLVTEISRLADELQLVRDILDEIRTDIQWAVQNSRIQIVRGECEAGNLPPVTLFEPGDAVEFEHEGQEEFGEVMTVDDAGNTAAVMLIPSQERMTVSQDILRKVTPDPLQLEGGTSDSTEEITPKSRDPSEKKSQQPHKSKGRLF